MRHLLGLVLLVLLGACATWRPAGDSAERPVEVEVLRDGARWTAEFRFPGPAPAWGFFRSALAAADQQPWRPRSWTVETPGVRLERVGRYDLLVADGGEVPRTVRIRFTPFSGELVSDYTPALAFSNGGTALFSEQFAAFSVASREAAARLPAHLDGAPIGDTGTRVTLRDQAGPLLHAGRRQQSVTVQNATSYVLFGVGEPIITDATAAIIDPQLPRWVASALAELTPAILARYAQRLGPAPAGRPTVLASWAGPTPERTSMNGGVVPGTIIMRFEGEGVLTENRALRNLARWFVAHEGAHFWLGQAVRYESPADGWITEGGADLLAVRMVAGLDAGYDWRARLDRSIADCVRLASGHSVASAQERNAHDAYYGCGAALGLVAEAAQRRATGGDFFTFVRTLVDANRADGVLTRDEWLAELTRLSRDPSLARDIRIMVETGVPDPAAHLQSLFARAGVPHRRDAQGRLVLS